MERRDDASTRRIRPRRSCRRAIARAVLVLALPLLIAAVLAPDSQAAFGFKAVGLTFSEEDTSAATRAGSHPYAWTISFALNTTGTPPDELPDDTLKDLRIQLPPGLVGTPDLLPHCSHADFINRSCPPASEVGTAGLSTASGETRGLEFPIHNLEPPPGSAAQLGFMALTVPIVIDLRMATQPPYNLTAELADVSQADAFFGATLKIKGAPGGFPLLTLPRSCAPAPTIFEADRWEVPDAWVSAPAAIPLSLTGCGELPFAPTLAVEPTTRTAGAPSGLDLELDAPDEGITLAAGTAHADLAGAGLTLPPQMTINPALAAGLAACTAADLARETPTSAPGEGCPQAAKIGTATATTPLLEGGIEGTIYVAQAATADPRGEHPFDSRYALYLVLRNPRRGILVRLPIEITADPVTGRVRATMDQLPQLPLDHLELHFNRGPRAPLTAPSCGTHSISSSLTPSSGAVPLLGSTAFTTDGDCAPPGFHPDLTAGTASNAAGRSAPFLFDLASDPTEANPAGLELNLPPGLSASLAAASLCPEAAAATAECPPDSRLGYARIAVGRGSSPLWIPEEGKAASAVYLAGPYRNAPYSLLVKVPAEAGPFDLGTVVLRAALQIDPVTAAVSVDFDGLPQILGGVPLHYRAIRVVLDRPGFIRNPTSCRPTRIGLTANAADGATSTADERFQAADCEALGFRPTVVIHLSGGLGRNAHPQINIDFALPAAGANVAAATFTLPAGELLDVDRIRALCGRELPLERCPRSSRIGRIRLRSPLLPEVLQGAIFLRAPTRRYPDLLAELRAGGVRIFLHGHTAAAPGGRLRVRLTGLPDVPLSEGSLVLFGGRRGIFVNSENPCARQRRVTAVFQAHNEKRRRLRPLLRLPGLC
jgi:hypothetical protein